MISAKCFFYLKIAFLYAIALTCTASFIIFIVLCTSPSLLGLSEASVGCRDEDGQMVDSFILYKLPQDKNSNLSSVQQGLGYMYLLPKPGSGSQYNGSMWEFSKRNISDSESVPGQTLQDLYFDNPSFMKNSYVMMYNDEFPNGKTSESHGHTKGVVVLTDIGGYWFIHSTPKYPPSPEEKQYSYPSTGQRYGQSFMCISLDKSQAEVLGSQLMYNKPFIYFSNIGESIKNKFKTLEYVVEGGQPPRDHTSSVANIATAEQTAFNMPQRFVSYNKFTDYGRDLYSALVAPDIGAGLQVESWRNGPNPLPSDCNATDYKVENIESLNAPAANLSFTTHHDHSKWAISTDADKPYVCVGDINRMASQKHRAGGTLCIRSQQMWNHFKQMVGSVETCPTE